jgi:nucleotide-binding universal stress UspA family protein
MSTATHASTATQAETATRAETGGHPRTGTRPPAGTTARIVVGIDGSGAGTHALTWAVREATRRGARVHAVAVRYAPNLGPLTPGSPSAAGRRRPHDSGPRVAWLTRIVERVRAGVPDAAPVEVTAPAGDPGGALAAASEGADLLVLGSQGRGTLAAAYVGSVTAMSLRDARCAVVIVPPST